MGGPHPLGLPPHPLPLQPYPLPPVAACIRWVLLATFVTIQKLSLLLFTYTMSNNDRCLEVLVACHMKTNWVVCVEDRAGQADKVLERCRQAATGARYKLCRGVPCKLSPTLPKAVDKSTLEVHVVWRGSDFGDVVRVDVGMTPSEQSYKTILRHVKWESQTVRMHKDYLERRADAMTFAGGNESHPKGFIDPAVWDNPQDKTCAMNQLVVQHSWDKSESCTTSNARHTDGKGLWLRAEPGYRAVVEQWSTDIVPATHLGLVVDDPLPPVVDVQPWNGDAVPDSPMDYDPDEPITQQHILPEHDWLDMPSLSASAPAPQPWCLELTEPDSHADDAYWTQTFDFAVLKKAYKNL